MYSTYGLVFAALLNARATVTNGNVTSKNIDFVDEIKLNLRRNNDDYIDTIAGNTLGSTIAERSDGNTNNDLVKLHIGTTADINNSITNAGNSNRRANGEQSWEFDYNDKKTRTVISTATSNRTDNNLATTTKDSLRLRSNIKLTKYKPTLKKNISKSGGHNGIQMANLKNQSIDPKNLKLAHIPKLVKKKRIDKFKNFMAQNRDLLKLPNSKPESRVEKTQLKQQHSNKDLKELNLNALRNQARVKVADEDRDTRLPDPQLLDMAPARGGRIHKLRVKGRLCFRHVLLPEGPKYDGRGRWYVPAHALVARRPYAASPAPRLLLPRCCNCCKKSVLGCQ